MSWYVVGDEEMLGQFASTVGLEDLRAAAPEGGAVLAFLDAGETDDAAALREALGALDADDHSVLDTAAALRDLLEGQRAALLTDGVVEDDEDLDKFDPDQPVDERVDPGADAVGKGVGVEGTVVKKDDERQIAFGWFSVVEIDGEPVTDTQGDRITPDELERAAYDFTLYARKGGEMHDAGDDGEAVGVGRLVESVVFTEEKQRAMVESLRAQGVDAHLDLGCVAWWGGFKIADPETWRRVKEGELRAWSIGGRGRREDVVEKYSPDQPRAEAGSPEGGQWVSAMGGTMLGRPMRDKEKQQRAALVDLMQRPGGARAREIMAALGWNNIERSGAAQIAAMRRAGYNIRVTRGPDGEKVYQIVGRNVVPPPTPPVPDGDEYLTTREIRGMVRHDGGISETHFVTFHDGTKAVFKPKDGEPDYTVRNNITPGMDAEREVAAWHVAQLVGMQDLVAPSRLRTVPGALVDRRGPQIGVMVAWQPGKEAADVANPFDGHTDMLRAAVFDFVIGNEDRHRGNWMVDDKNRIHLIDHGLAFPDSGPVRQWGNHQFVDYAQSAITSAEVTDHNAPKKITDIARSYKDKLPQITSALRSAGLPQGSIDGVVARVEALSRMRGWRDFR